MSKFECHIQKDFFPISKINKKTNFDIKDNLSKEEQNHIKKVLNSLKEVILGKNII